MPFLHFATDTLVRIHTRKALNGKAFEKTDVPGMEK
jgi:hypothetical protein